MKHIRTPRGVLLSTVTEAAWRKQVITWAKAAGWRIYSIHDSRRQTWGTDKGFPDLFMARGGRVIAAELKRHRGVLTDEQRQWINDLRWSGLSVYVWRPTDEVEVKELLGYSAQSIVNSALVAGHTENAGETVMNDDQARASAHQTTS